MIFFRAICLQSNVKNKIYIVCLYISVLITTENILFVSCFIKLVMLKVVFFNLQIFITFLWMFGWLDL